LTAKQDNIVENDINDPQLISGKAIDSAQQVKSETATGTTGNAAQKNASTWKWLLLAVLILSVALMFKRIFSKKNKK